jgi:hypothetical protein
MGKYSEHLTAGRREQAVNSGRLEEPLGLRPLSL